MQQQQRAATVSGLSLESYLQLHKAITKHGTVVQSVTAIEECYYKIADLRSLLQLHGLAANKFNRTELLAAIKGQKLINPCFAAQSPGLSDTSLHATDQERTGQHLPTAQAVCAVLGLPAASSPTEPSLKFLQLPSGLLEQKVVGEQIDAPSTTAFTDQCQAGPNGLAVPAQDVGVKQPAAPAQTETMQCAQTAHMSSCRSYAVAQLAPSTQADGFQDDGAQRVQLANKQPATMQATASSSRPSTAGTVAGAAPLDPLQQLLAVLLRQQSSGLDLAGALASLTTLPQPPLVEPTQIIDTILQDVPSNSDMAASTTVQPTQKDRMAPAASVSLHAEMPTAPAPAMPPALVTSAPPATTPPATYTALLPQQNTAEVSATAVQHCARLTSHLSARSMQAPGQHSSLTAVPEQLHAPWLKPQLQWHEDHGLKVSPSSSSTADEGTDGEGSLLGRRVGFVLTEDMRVTGLKNTFLTLPAGFYEGMAVKYLGSNCQHEVCDFTCTSHHLFYRARILPPRAVPEPNSSSSGADLASQLAKANAAACGRPVLLILDLHPQLRVHSLADLLRMPTAQQLQDAWVLVQHEDEPHDPEVLEHTTGQGGCLEPAAVGKRLRKTSSCKSGPHKRIKGI